MTMSYSIKIRREAKRKLQNLTSKTRLRIVDKIMELGQDPDSITLDTKSLTGTDLYRLRVGGWRVIYDRQDAVKIIAIERIRSRGDVYK
ncbi:MAG: type II toxin-antitoxin system RelE/ParE family toxin [Magnetococcales bacterium]|nr:type II toxin-antitoxin system RelE/ParE family toxin [Magnetococcales bacterium]